MASSDPLVNLVRNMSPEQNVLYAKIFDPVPIPLPKHGLLKRFINKKFRGDQGVTLPLYIQFRKVYPDYQRDDGQFIVDLARAVVYRPLNTSKVPVWDISRDVDLEIWAHSLYDRIEKYKRDVDLEERGDHLPQYRDWLASNWDILMARAVLKSQQPPLITHASLEDAKVKSRKAKDYNRYFPEDFERACNMWSDRKIAEERRG